MIAAFLLVAALADDAARVSLREGERLWRMKHTRSAIAAFERAARVKETAAAAQLALGRIYYFKGFEAEGALPGFHEEVAYREKALAAFEAALRLRPASAEARLWRYRTLRGLGRDAGAAPPALAPAPADVAAADEIQKLRAAKKYAELFEPARAFAKRFPESERLPAVHDALIEAYQALPETLATLTAAIDARIAARPDPAAYTAGANALLARGEYDAAAKLAEALVPATATFIDENLGSYKLQGKATASLDRARAASLDLIGWALFLKGDLAGAEAKLLEAERLSRAQDFTNQVRLAELLAKKGANEDAREHYLNALSLTGGAPPQRAAATKVLAALRDAPGFDAWLEQDLARRREDRRARVLASLVDRPLPALPLQTLSGEPYDASKLRGRVLLYKFFASW